MLRSVAVAPAVRGLGLGLVLAADRLVAARARGVRVVYLLTTTAAALFERLGFRPIARDAVLAALAAHPELTGACPASAACLALAVPE